MSAMVTCKWLALLTFVLHAMSPRPYSRRGIGGSTFAEAKQPAAFECTERQEAEDLAVIAGKEHRYHQAMVNYF